MADLTGKNIIRQINANEKNYDIVAKYFSGTTGDYDLDDILSLVQGVVDTYVIKTQSNPTQDYKDVVYNEGSTVTTTKSKLNSLIGRTTGSFKVGDIILMEQASDGKKIFDRWVSNIAGDNITISVLETQVATHHHTIGTSKSSALIGVSASTQTATIPVVGSAVDVVTGVTGNFVTAVSFVGGSDELTLTSNSGSGSVGHSHNIDAHTHTVTIKPSEIVGDTANAYTSLASKSYTPHTHTTSTVAGAHVDGTEFKYIDGGDTDTFIKTLTDSDQTTGEESLTTLSNSAGLTTSTQVSGSKTGDAVLTTSSGTHNHTATVKTGSNVVTSVSLAAKVVTSVSYSAGTVQSKVITDVTTTSATIATSWSAAPTSDFLKSCAFTVDSSGVLSLDGSTGSAVTSATKVTSSSSVNVVNTVSSGSQTASSLSAPRADQNSAKSDVALSITIDNAGAHTHGFTHTHTIGSHTHDIAAHTHSYVKSVTSATGDAYTTLTSAKYKPHTHTNTTVAATAAASTAFTYVTGGSTTNVVSNLLSTDKVYTTASTALTTDTKYVKLEGDIVFPGLDVTRGNVSVTSSSITPAAAGTERAIKTITFSSASFVTGLDSKTSTNIGGDGSN